MENARLRRVEGQFQKDLAEILRLLAQEQFPGVLFTVSAVRITNDLSLARIQLSLFPVKNKEEIIKWVNAHQGRIKDQLVQKTGGGLRKMPDLVFYLDNALEQEAEIDRILKKGGDSPIK